ncbi:MAG TPA: beta-L-arabinofuranosidase domain-containing protein [Tissierellaceae bacterium]
MASNYIINSFEYRNVVLKDSHWKKQFDTTVEYYLAIPNESLLYPFRKKAGLPSPGQPLAGWYGTVPSIFGQILGAFSKMYRITEDYRIKEKALYLIKEWEKCVDKEPSLLKNDSYVFDKLLGGLLDLYEYMEYENALEYIDRLINTAIANFKRDIKRDGIQDEELVQYGMIEWYTLPENLYRAYELTENTKYREFAEEWEYDFYWNKLLDKDIKNIGARHAYSHVNTLSSAARAYKVKGDRKYLKIIENAYNEIVSNHIFATGGYGPAESIFVDNEGYLGDSLKSTWDETLEDPTYINFAGRRVTRSDTWGSCEVSCCAWAVFKLCNYLLKFTGNAKYGDWVEKMLYNGTGAQLPLGPNGKIMYYANYFIDGAVKSIEDRRLQPGGYGFTWQCCTGTFPNDVAEYYNMLYYYDEDSIYVSQYLPSKLMWSKNGNKIEIENFSHYPEEECVKFLIKTDKNIEFNFKFRIPSWLKKELKVKVNGEDINVNVKPNEWGIIKKVWNNNDIITIEMPFDLYFRPVDKKNSDIAALCYGPLVLVTNEMTEFIGDMENPSKWIHSVEGKRMVFRTDKGHVAGYDFLTRVFVPFYKIGPMQWYFMYNRIREN